MKWTLPSNKLLVRSSRSRHDQDQAPSALPASRHKFDMSTGQMYTEETISAKSNEERDWTRPRRMSLKSFTGLTNTHPAKGVRSLQNMAIETAIKKLMDLSFEGIARLPVHIVLRVWNIANERYIIPFGAWAIFSKVLKDEKDIPISILRYRQMIQSPRLTLQHYTAALTSPKFDFLTYLSLTAKFPVAQLVNLSNMKNLAILEIYHEPGDASQSGVSDRLVRTWHEAAVAEGAFSVLRILKLWHHKELTEKSLAYLNSFPALALFDVRGCTFNTRSRAHARTLGWKSTLDVGILNFFEAMCVERATLMRATVEEDPKPIRRAPCHHIWNNTIVHHIPRTEVAEFLTDANNSVSNKGPDAIKHWDGWQAYGELSALEQPGTSFKEYYFGICNVANFNPSYQNETWEFLVATTFSRIGELRSDRDLRAAGVQIDKQAIADRAIINSTPLASVRIGPYVPSLNPSHALNPIKSFYGSAYSESSDPQLGEFMRAWDKPENPCIAKFKPAIAPDSNNIAFYRVRLPRSKPDSPPCKQDEDQLERKKSKRFSLGDLGRRASKFAKFPSQGQGSTLEEEGMMTEKGGLMKSKRGFVEDLGRRPSKFAKLPPQVSDPKDDATKAKEQDFDESKRYSVGDLGRAPSKFGKFAHHGSDPKAEAKKAKERDSEESNRYSVGDLGRPPTNFGKFPPQGSALDDEVKHSEKGDFSSKESKRGSVADFGKRNSKFMQNKKQKLDDVLGSFM